MIEVTMYTTTTCPYCRNAKRLLDAKGIAYKEIDVRSVDVKNEMVSRSGRRTVPQIFFGNWHVGGFDDLAQLESEGGIDQVLNPRMAG
ncbi:Glutaredoxin 3 [Pseudomonas sp. IT-194MI4]|jgi:glutaredoxin 3|uniref:Glutaredoxin n=1 Tax=Pseudomonas reinekei TaxID=395598 RepID=A0A1H0UL53_PSERE|nr:glutaredoxin 3 [Pseudomonas reinekei]KAB0488344.1 glutaredoxin 3 [Pseudomonas reinekei]NBB63381.1 glutaredoxin 3 [Pseudomonas sp. ODNR1LW]OLU05829.1 glutaredoxin 3 [Pseudomonas reinekei]SDP67062.1 glutaredoxin 3 [Pseudomonas reinekei]